MTVNLYTGSTALSMIKLLCSEVDMIHYHIIREKPWKNHGFSGFFHGFRANMSEHV